ncbi:hypothetical protein [Novosphingobium sp. KN65.2]|uniref:hypothetical protein n=1 Tax=Novosphingobium sp. KN65.2 TaxID=1478134 RepID=UPI0005DFE5F7|nr:hypothetical protein [Novosphingobium sp. KN65.2]CDO34001.1 membrane hypothetical protein [Novosphingobium sp. KN65.2]
MMGDAVLSLGAVLAVTGVAMLRRSWSRRTRSHGLNLAAWGSLALSTALGWASAGAWGAAVEAIVAMALAFVLLGWAAWTSPPGKALASNRRVGMLPENGAPLGIGRRIVTFTFVAILALASSLALAMAGRLLALVAGAGEANANAISLFVTPLAWMGLAYALMMTGNRRRQVVMLAIAAVAAVPAYLIGAMT